MTKYPLQDLLNRWQREELTVEQAIGQLLQHLIAFEQRLDNLRQRFNKLSLKQKD